MSSDNVIDPKDTQQLAKLLLLSPQTGEPMTFCSRLFVNADGSFSFDVRNPATGEKYRITARVDELIEPQVKQ